MGNSAKKEEREKHEKELAEAWAKHEARAEEAKADVRRLNAHQEKMRALGKANQALWMAAYHNDTAAFARAKFDGADINLPRDADKKTPAHAAAIRGSEKVLRRLIEMGADLDAKDATGKTPLDCAKSREHADEGDKAACCAMIEAALSKTG